MLEKMKLTLYFCKSTLVATKEVIRMHFTVNNRLVKNYVLLILAEKMTYDEVPAIFNMREAVAELLELEQSK